MCVRGLVDARHRDQAPASLAAAIADRLAFLTTETTELVRVAAVLGAECSVTELAVVTGCRRCRGWDQVEQAGAAEVLDLRSPGRAAVPVSAGADGVVRGDPVVAVLG